jgi:hypothetical protein
MNAWRFMFHSAFRNIALLLGISGLIFSSGFGQTATVPNASFATFIAATDSFPGWSFKKDSLSGTRYTITQETDSAHSTPGALKIQIKDAPDTTFTAGITGTITGLPPKKIFTVTAWVKYVNTTDAYKNAQFAVSQATTLSAAPWYIFRKWSTLWENSTVSSNGWTQITFSDTTADSANYITIVISLWKSGTLWVDDIAVTYQNIPSAINYVDGPGKQGSVLNNRISFSGQTPYVFEACSIDGKMVMRRSGLASELNLDRVGLKNGLYLLRVQTPEKTYTSKVMVSR